MSSWFQTDEGCVYQARAKIRFSSMRSSTQRHHFVIPGKPSSPQVPPNETIPTWKKNQPHNALFTIMLKGKSKPAIHYFYAFGTTVFKLQSSRGLAPIRGNGCLHEGVSFMNIDTSFFGSLQALACMTYLCGVIKGSCNQWCAAQALAVSLKGEGGGRMGRLHIYVVQEYLKQP